MGTKKKVALHPSAANKRITGLSFVRDMGNGRWGKDPRRQVELLMVLAVPADIVLPDHAQIVVEGDLNPDGTIRLNLHAHLVVDSLRPTPAELEFDGGEHLKRMRKSIKDMRIDQVLTTLRWQC